MTLHIEMIQLEGEMEIKQWVLLTGCLLIGLLLTGCTAPMSTAIQQCQIHGDTEMTYEGTHLDSRDFGVPRGTYVCIGLDEPYPLFVVSERQRIDVGTLSYQFGEMPFKTIVLKMSPKYYVIVGILDEGVEGSGLTVRLIHGGIGGEVGKTTRPSRYGMLWVPIHELNLPNWETIERAYISINWGDTKTLEEEFDPGVNVIEQAIPVNYP